MKKLSCGGIGLCFVVLTALAGLGSCTLSPIGVPGAMDKALASQPSTSMADFEHFRGQWRGTYTDLGGYSFGDNWVFRKDGTFTEMADFPPAVMDTGTMIVDPATRTVTTVITYSSDESIIPTGYSISSTYSFSNDHKTLTITSQGGGIESGTGVYTRQTSNDEAEHFVGEWHGAYTGSEGYSFSDNFIFRIDGTYTETADLQPPLPFVTDSGIMLIDPATQTITGVITSADTDIVPLGYVFTYSYSFSNDYRTLTCVFGDGAGTGVYTKQ